MRATPWGWLALLAGCDGADAPAGTVAVPAAPRAVIATSAPRPTVATPVTAPNGDRIVRETAVVAPSPRPAPPMRTTKDFTDPPLPRELRDDGGLLPLPAASPKTTEAKTAEESER